MVLVVESYPFSERHRLLLDFDDFFQVRIFYIF